MWGFNLHRHSEVSPPVEVLKTFMPTKGYSAYHALKSSLARFFYALVKQINFLSEPISNMKWNEF